MAVNTYSSDFDLGPARTCIRNEGNATVADAFTNTGRSITKSITWASQLHKGEIVAIDADTGNTGLACKMLPVVRAVANGDATIIGIIETEPVLQKPIPSSAAADSVAERLAGEYYRTATVRFFGVNAIGPATLVTANAAAIVPGVVGTLMVDVSGSAGAGNGLVVNDVATGGTGMFSFHAAAQAAGVTVSILVGFTNLLTGAT
jgi:hypothetical protein